MLETFEIYAKFVFLYTCSCKCITIIIYVLFLQKLGAKVNIFCIYYHIFMNWYVYLEAGT